jgi:superfamily II DNA or RNA helicase
LTTPARPGLAKSAQSHGKDVEFGLFSTGTLRAPPAAMPAADSSLRPGDLVRIRDQRWRIVTHAPLGDAAIVEAAGCDAWNRTMRARFLLPFEPIDRLPSSPAPRVVRPGRWRRAVRRVLADATPSWTCLRTAAQSNLALIPYQLEPALALVCGRGCRFLLADEVGLGKTVQAGVMMAEVLARRADARALVIAPAALRDQWRHELSARFHLDADVLDAGGIARIAADLPPAINPWSLPKIVVTSIDYIKRPEVMRSIERLTWDFVAFDEAHNLAGRSDRAAAAQAVARRSRAVALLTATPHSGDEEAFQRLCGIGDMRTAYPLLIFRRTRADAGLAGRRRTIVRRVQPTTAELVMHTALMAYARRAWAEASGDTASGARLAMTVLTRRACSSAGALVRSLDRRLALLDERPSHGVQPHLPFADTSGDDDEPGAWLGSRGLRDAGEERGMLAGLLDLARKAAVHESKLAWLRRFLRRSREPAIIFTEYRDTLATVSAALPGIDAVQLHGGLTSRERREVLSRFTAGSARLLLATDAASEGLNLHHRCRLVINLELPWTPVRLDQRAGRVDRIGQARTVHVIRLVAAGTCEESVVARLASRVDRINHALSAVTNEALVAESVLGAGAETPSPACPEQSLRDVIRVDMRHRAAEETARLTQVRTWLRAASDHEDSRPAITRLRPRPECPLSRVWAFRVVMTSAADDVLWETVIGAALRKTFVPAAHGLATPSRSASATRAALSHARALERLVGEASAHQLKRLGVALSPPLALWLQRELDLIENIRQEHARMSATLLQPGLFDRRTDRAAASQAAMLDAALSHCRSRLEGLRAWGDLRAECGDLAFAVMLE